LIDNIAGISLLSHLGLEFKVNSAYTRHLCKTNFTCPSFYDTKACKSSVIFDIVSLF